MVRVGKKVWKGEEEVKLSKLLATFWQRHGCLPHLRAYGFWKAVKDRLQRFSNQQIQRKVYSLRKRHLQIISGNARELKPQEAETFSIWVKMIGRSGDDTQDEEDDVAPAVGRVVEAAEDAVNEHKESAHCEDTDGVQADADEGQASGHQGLQNEGLGGEHAGYGMGDKGVGARGCTEEVDSSCCIVEEPDEPDDPEEVEEVEEEEEVEEMEEEQQQEQGWDAAAECDSAQDNHQAFRQEAASPDSNLKQEFKMLTCITMADLASAVRTLAEIVARSQPVPV